MLYSLQTFAVSGKGPCGLVEQCRAIFVPSPQAAQNETVTVRSQTLGAVTQSATNGVAPGMLKVLFVTNMYPEDNNPGSGAFVRQQADHLRKAGHQIDVLHIESKRSRLKYLTSLIDVFARTRTRSYDVVHAHYGLSGFPALFRYKTPLVVTLHGSDALIGHIQPMISKTVCSFADAVIVVSKGISARIAGDIIPCGIDLEMFRPRDRAAARNRLGLPQQGKVVLFPFDPLRKIKRYELARAAVDALCDPDIQILTVCGKRNEDMPWYYSAADVMVLCSESEGSPTSVKEALACNVPVVSTDVGDVREIMDGIDGCEICTDNTESLAQGLKHLLGKQNDKTFDGRSSMLRYDQSRVVAAIVKVYQRVIHGRLASCRQEPQPHSPENYTSHN
jgi:teichuronic acid biosynthesis glycosyltransferase TuaC